MPDDDYDDEDDRPRRRRRRPVEDDDYDDEHAPDDTVASVIPYRNPLALSAYYCGVFSLIPCLGLLLGPVALILGILGLRAVSKNKKAKGTGHAIAGIVLGGLATLGNAGALIVMAVMASQK